MPRASKLFLRLVLPVLVVGIGAIAYLERADVSPIVERWASAEGELFSADPLPVPSMLYLYDLGIVDANADGRLDIYSANHNYRQQLWLADGQGGFAESLSRWGLDQSAAFPGIEQSLDAPAIDKPGLYVYWRGDVLNLVAHRIEELGPLKGTLRLYNRVDVLRQDGFEARVTSARPAPIGMPESRVEFTAARSGRLELYLATRGTLLSFGIESPWAKSNVFVGTQAAQAAAPEFDFILRDRHGMAWADVNADGRPDVFISRGGLGGTLRMFPPAVRDRVADEWLVSRGEQGFVDQTAAAGFEKRDCSGRHVRWADFDRDGRLDLFINCQDRGNVAGSYPKQLWRQDAPGHFTEVAAAVGLDVPEHQIIDFAWLDADGDGDVDMLTYEDTGFFLYTQTGGRFERSPVHRGAFVRADMEGLRNNTADYWQFDGKLSVSDFNNDGDLDVFMASKRGNALLLNRRGRFEAVDLAALGLPTSSVAASWVDYDSDGLPDLHVVPEGIYRQDSGGRFTATGLFSLSRNRYQAAFVHWFDRDNDGTLDLVMALQENAALWRWWERPFKSKDVKGEDDRFTWPLMAYRNVGARGHWLQLDLVGPEGNRNAIGARVTLVDGGRRHTQEVGSQDSSYSSQGHYRVYLGLGERTEAGRIEIRWPDGHLQVLDKVKADQLLKVTRDVRA
jgi:hypothetical protein